MQCSLQFGRVTGQTDRILILAAGPSIQQVDLRQPWPRGVWVIAVNTMIKHCLPDAWVTVDPNEQQRKLMAAPRIGVEYFAAVPDDYGTRRAQMAAHTQPAEPGIKYLHRIVNKDVMAKAAFGLAEDSSRLHSGNSAWGALGLAYHKRPRKIGLLGVDAITGASYGIGGGIPRSPLDHLPALFASALPQLQSWGIEVRNGSLRSRIDCFPKVAPEQLLEWLQE